MKSRSLVGMDDFRISKSTNMIEHNRCCLYSSRRLGWEQFYPSGECINDNKYILITMCIVGIKILIPCPSNKEFLFYWVDCSTCCTKCCNSLNQNHQHRSNVGMMKNQNGLYLISILWLAPDDGVSTSTND